MARSGMVGMRTRASGELGGGFDVGRVVPRRSDLGGVDSVKHEADAEDIAIGVAPYGCAGVGRGVLNGDALTFDTVQGQGLGSLLRG